MEQLRKSEICTFLVPLKDIHFLHFMHSYLDKLLFFFLKKKASCIYASFLYFFTFSYLKIVDISILENSWVSYLGGKFKHFPKAMASSVLSNLFSTTFYILDKSDFIDIRITRYHLTFHKEVDVIISPVLVRITDHICLFQRPYYSPGSCFD